MEIPSCFFCTRSGDLGGGSRGALSSAGSARSSAMNAGFTVGGELGMLKLLFSVPGVFKGGIGADGRISKLPPG